LETK